MGRMFGDNKARVAFGVLVIVVILVVWGMRSLYGTVAPVSGAYTVQGLSAPVTIHFDEYERPFVEAGTLDDALFAQGWLHASHRLWQMELFRRAGRGRLSELLGGGMLDTDKELWRAGVPQLAQRLEENASAEMHAHIEAYVAGVNAALDARTSSPPEFWLLRTRPAPWQAGDVYALGALMAYQTSNNASNELLRLALFEAVDTERAAIFLPDDGILPDHPFVIPRSNAADLAAALKRLDRLDPSAQPLFPSFALGSNAWALAPARTREGVALCAFDSHDSLGIPNLLYEVHLFFDDGKQIRGWSAAGLPGVITGFNERIAWGFTTIGDSQDLYFENRSSDDPMLFRDSGEWYRAEVERVEIPVSGRDAPEVLEVVHTRNGPLISEQPPIAMRWAVHEAHDMGIDSLLKFNRAQNWEDFNDALNAFPAPALAAVYADVDGNIGFRVAGALPVRRYGEGLFPLRGDDPAMRWEGLIEPSELPARYNPPEGFVAAANARVNAAGEGPLVSADNAPGYRIRRIQSVLGSRHDFSAEDMRLLQMDWYDGQAALLLPTLLDELDGTGFIPIEAEALGALKEWLDDPIAAPDLAAPLIFQLWYRALIYAIFEPALSPELFQRWVRATYPVNHAVDRLILREPDNPWWRGERSAIITEAFRNAVEDIRELQGNRFSMWRLDRTQSVGLRHDLAEAVPRLGWLFNVPAEPWGGSGSTVGRARYRYDQPNNVSAGATIRFVGVMSPAPRVESIIPGGQSGHPFSDHYYTQFPLWLAGDLLPIPTTADEVEGTTQTLTPR